MNDSIRPHASRRQHQQALARARRRRRNRRMTRIRRIRLLKTARSIQFWTRFGAFVIGLIAVAFWAKFAFVYDIPSYAQRGALQNVRAYVTVKPWWFGPPMFDLGNYQTEPTSASIARPYDVMLQEMEKYGEVVTHPIFVWVAKP